MTTDNFCFYLQNSLMEKMEVAIFLQLSIPGRSVYLLSSVTDETVRSGIFPARGGADLAADDGDPAEDEFAHLLPEVLAGQAVDDEVEGGVGDQEKLLDASSHLASGSLSFHLLSSLLKLPTSKLGCFCCSRGQLQI
jgi:hypothetical protein